MFEYVLLLLSLARAAVRDREALVVENLLLRHQLAVLTRPTRRRSRLRARDKLVWVVVRAFRRDWRRHLVLVRPESVIRWHRQAWRLFWRWRSRGPLGRPRLRPEVRELIATMARDKSPLGQRAHPWRVAEARAGGLQALDPALPTAWACPPIQPDLAHLPAQPRPPPLGCGSADCADAHLQDPLRAGLHRPWSARAGAHQRDG
jgi:hypothetical protein